MGNCMFSGFEDFEQVIKILTPNGGIMEFYPPITVESITNEFPHHGIFRNGGFFSQPLLHKEELLTGELYHLLPLNSYRNQILGADGYWSTGKSPKATYRMSFDHHKIWRRAETELVNKQNAGAIWKVKLAISPEKLTEILSQEDGTRALVESVRTVAKCSNGASSNSDLWSLSSSRKTSENVV